MPAFNFQKQFAEAVESGQKTQTIRAKRKNRPQVGQTAHCFTGMRTSACRCLGRWPIIHVCDIEIALSTVTIQGVRHESVTLMNTLAHHDGFENYREMIDWFLKTHGLPFFGDIVVWKWAE